MEEEQKKKRGPKKLLIAASCVGLLAAAYLGVGIFFRSHFVPNSRVNGIDSFGKTAQQMADLLADREKAYHMVIKTADGATEQVITPDMVDLSSNLQPGDMSRLLANQQAFLWPRYLLGDKLEQKTSGWKLNRDKLNALVDALPEVSRTDLVQTKNADLVYDQQQKSYLVQEEVYGNNIDTDRFKDALADAIVNLQEEISLADYAVQPTLKADDSRLKELIGKMNQIAQMKITLKIGGDQETVPQEKIISWIGIDENANMVVHDEAIRAYVGELAGKYDTVGKNRSFRSSYGAVVNISSGDYGRKVDQEAEFNALKGNLTDGRDLTRDLNFSQKAAGGAGDDIGSSYVEVNLTAQHLFVYKDGRKVVDTAVTTGKPVNHHQTNVGIFRVKSHEANRTLRGRNDDGSSYASPVKYWMPFDGGIGLHDAPWKSNYGGKNYLTNGSHGCVNLPPSVAGSVFANVSVGMPVIVYNLPGTETSCTDSAVQAVINKISKAGSGPAAAKAATDAYQALSAAQKKDVYNLSALKEAQNKYAAALADAAKVEEHEQAVNTDHE
ncbi:peptidoglycan binding domain protein [Shuttleworthella sp. MSX8B]|uniref:L,D-transpeptidase family protein n=1 Tax=Shuttleworthella sp. MSX8B TaxID=936574 RepID=UPI0004503C92|nr:L,D-transpeptidase/peptidoglycan binding protein [Shuttleworthia sp. MSX8B]EUB14640.1 peptidoglycan binding domain protein [Shuttleworthia sp. MSX8B]